MSAGVRSEEGQASVEYLIVGLVILVVAVGLVAVFHLVCDGVLAAHVSSSTSHVATNGVLGVIGDVAFF